MAFSGVLARNESAPERLAVTAVVTFAPKAGGGMAVSRSDLTVRGRVPGMDQERFSELAREGEAGCPVSNALRGNVEMTVDAALDA